MAKVFQRKIDYYLATWTCLVALIGIYMTANAVSLPLVSSFVGIGVALATTIYGFYMIYMGRFYSKSISKI